MFITDSGDVDFSRSFLLALDRNTSQNHTLPFDLYPGHYRVYVYDIEHDGTLNNGVGYPAVTQELFTSLTNNAYGTGVIMCRVWIDTRQLQLFNCTLDSSSGLIWALCSHPGSSFAAGIQVIVQSTNVSEVHKLYVNQSMDLNTPVTVPVERDGEYQVSIFAIRKEMGIGSPSLQFRDSATVTNDFIQTSAAATTQDISTAPGLMIVCMHVLL